MKTQILKQTAAANFTESVNYMHKLKVGTLIRPWRISEATLTPQDVYITFWVHTKSRDTRNARCIIMQGRKASFLCVKINILQTLTTPLY